jgi:hypothetical protein
MLLGSIPTVSGIESAHAVGGPTVPLLSCCGSARKDAAHVSVSPYPCAHQHPNVAPPAACLSLSRQHLRCCLGLLQLALAACRGERGRGKGFPLICHSQRCQQRVSWSFCGNADALL